ncbi:MAG: 16S rRNA (guanine(966)-N(2))-methyltransferase RsmD [Thiobacillaceae bacterium]|nr:16S rRNA (guanine(966)-N(2))-methyltransferase RsmD [Thiobacillaceae bacterium]MCX7673396.1 16S rRNA (guanine(966)-N(2))-methyltransferase RsmD [Thiobacillaceae bacterium]MDW8323160.1 16S rRNA (guanine(966)-N(2))-methyltransferase RsmD [Burkholderiales bacterium]
MNAAEVVRAQPGRGGPNRVRIIGGAWRSRVLRFPARPGLRPTPGRVRETLFNWLGQDLSGWRCLDLFAGSGALGFEAASRGAAEVVLVERDARALAALRRNAEALGAQQVRIVPADALAFLHSAPGRFDLILLDPPYDSALLAPALAAAGRCLQPHGKIYVEARVVPDLSAWRVLRQGRAGESQHWLLEALPPT